MKKMMTGPLPRLRYLTAAEIGPFRQWMFRPYCWLNRRHEPHHCDVYFEVCALCGKLLWSKSRDGQPNPLRGAAYSSLFGKPCRPGAPPAISIVRAAGEDQ